MLGDQGNIQGLQQPLLLEDASAGDPNQDNAWLEEYSSKNILKNILLSTSSLGVRGLVVAIHYAGTGLIMSSLGGTAAAASSITTTVQGLILSTSSGFLLSTGIALGAALTRPETLPVESIIKTSWAMTLIFGALTIGALNSTKWTLPLILNKEVADTASDYLKYFSVAAIPDLLIWNNGQIIFQIEKNSWMPLLANVTYRFPALALSYYFGSTLAWGAKGVAFGSGVAGWANVFLYQAWFSRAAYNAFNLYRLNIPDFKEQAIQFLSSGWKLSLQRITEWGNLAILAQIIGHWSSQGLIAAQPSILLLNLCGLLSQGFGQASMMIATRDCKEMKEALADFEATGNRASLVKAEHLKAKNQKNFYVSNIAGLGFNLLLAGTTYLARMPLLHLYAPEDTPESTVALAETLLWINALNLIPDAIRIVSGGVLRGWGDLLIPTLASLFIMSGLGVAAGVAWGAETDKSIEPLFIMRLITLLFAAGFNCVRFAGHTRRDEAEYQRVAALANDENWHPVARTLSIQDVEETPMHQTFSFDSNVGK